MTIDQFTGELMDVIFDACPVDASLLGGCGREDRLAGHTEAAGGRP
jgi:hypothetical protein